jgi:hypothetical protein
MEVNFVLWTGIFVRNVQDGPEATASYARHTELHILSVSFLDNFTFFMTKRSSAE